MALAVRSMMGNFFCGTCDEGRKWGAFIGFYSLIKNALRVTTQQGALNSD
tara:strand:+ start:102 stop:251 length:150 start_codon:yes stop_codon:yes gene_type:complete